MSNATRSVSIERGFDPRQFTFFSFGGTSPLFQSEICRSLRIADIVVPGDSSGFCARGLLEADRSESYVESLYWTSERPLEELNPVFERLEERARRDFAEQGFAPGDLAVVRGGRPALRRPVGSAATIPLPPGRLGRRGAADRGAVRGDLRDALRPRHGVDRRGDRDPELRRLSVVAPSQTFPVVHGRRGADTSPEPIETRRAYAPARARWATSRSTTASGCRPAGRCAARR